MPDAQMLMLGIVVARCSQVLRSPVAP